MAPGTKGQWNVNVPACLPFLPSVSDPLARGQPAGICESSTVTSEHHCDMPQDNCPEVYLCLSPGLFPPGPLSPLTVPQHPL